MGASCDELGRRLLICVSGTFIRLIDVLAAPPTLPIRRRKMRRTHLFTKNPLRFDAANDFLTALFMQNFFHRFLPPLFLPQSIYLRNPLINLDRLKEIPP